MWGGMANELYDYDRVRWYNKGWGRWKMPSRKMLTWKTPALRELRRMRQVKEPAGNLPGNVRTHENTCMQSCRDTKY